MSDFRKLFMGRKGAAGGGREPPRPPEPPPQALKPAPEQAHSVYAGRAKMPPAMGSDAYARDAEERKAFEREKHVILNGTVQRIYLGEYLPPLVPGNHEEGHSLEFIRMLGKRPANVRGHLSLVKDGKKEQDGVYEQLSSAMGELKRHSLPLGEGPYADRNGELAKLADIIFKGAKDGDIGSAILHVCELRPFLSVEMEARFPRLADPGYRFVLEEEHMTPDELSTAGNILAQGTRLARDDISGGLDARLAHILEPYVLAVAALRSREIPAYFAHAVTRGEGDKAELYPLIAVVDLTKDVPLLTFNITLTHPPMGAVDIVSDTAMLGGLHAALAEARVKHLTAEMYRQHESGRELTEDELDNQLTRIARSMFQSVKRWTGSHYVNRAFNYLYEDLVGALLAIDPVQETPHPAGGIITMGPGVVRQQSIAEVNASNFVGHVQTVLGKMLTDAEKEPGLETG
ncbi:MAG: hypothetical protein AB1324_03355 [Candidatus Micrarchaeota archaeon]